MSAKNAPKAAPKASAPPAPTAQEAPPVIEQAGGERLHVAARVDGFRRCGRAWPATGTTISTSEFSPEDIERLKGEKELIVTAAEE